MWRWADPDGQQRRVRFDELRAALAGGLIAPNTPVWRPGWPKWQPAHEVPELSASALSAANGVVPNIPPPPLAVVAVQLELESQAAGGRAPSMYEEPPPPPKYVPAPPRSGSLTPPPPSVTPPPDIGSDRSIATQVGGTPPPALATPPKLGSSLPTAIGIPPPPELVQMASARAGGISPTAPRMPSKPPPPVPASPRDGNDMIEELSGSMLLDDSKSALLDNGGLPPPTEPVIRENALDGSDVDDVVGLPPRRPGLSLIISDLKEIRAGRPPKNKLLIAVLGVVGLSGIIMIVAVIASAFGGKPSDGSASGTASASATGSASSAAPVATTAATETAAPPATSTAVVPAKEEPKAPSVELGDCTVSGDARVLAPRALIATGIEAAAGQTALALGFAPSIHDAIGVSLDPGSLTPMATVRARSAGDIKRVVPFFSGGKVVVVADSDRKGDRIQSRRFVPTSSPVDVGVADNAIVWAPRGKDSFAKLFALDGDAPVEAMRAIPLPSGKGVALAFRRGNAIYVGVATGDAVLNAEGELSRIPGLGQVGSPAIAASGDSVVVAWADRAGKDDAWGIRWTKRSISGATNEPRALVLPEGGLGGPAMSPSVAGLGRGKFLLAWTEGPVSGHQVRAITFNADGVPSGSPLAISALGVNAGQPQATVGVDGRGVVAFLAAKGKHNELMATSILCPAR